MKNKKSKTSSKKDDSLRELQEQLANSMVFLILAQFLANK